VNGATHISVEMRLSPDSLEALLREEGLMSASGVKVLPLIEVVDGRGGHYVWWTSSAEDDKGSMAQDGFKRFFARFSAKLKSKNVYALDPTSSSFRMGVPASYRIENLKREDQMLLAQYLKADVVLSGKISADRPAGGGEPAWVYDLQLWQAKSGRAIGEIQRAEPLASGNPKVVEAALDQGNSKVIDELGARLNETIMSGNLNLNVVKLLVNGNMDYRQQVEFKRQLAQLRDIRVIKERLFEPSRVVFEAETPISGVELGKVLQKTKFVLFTVGVQNAQDDSLVVNVQALSSASAQ
jgi:hypothetical protein